MKNELRQSIIKQRQSLSDAQIDETNKRFLKQFIDFFTGYQKTYKPKIIGGYVSINNEITVLPALGYCRDLGFETALPYCHGHNMPLTFHCFNGDRHSLIHDNFNIPAPNPEMPVVIPDLIICPAVGVCRQTHKRLGYGGGFYDKYAEKNPHSHFVGGFCDYQMIDDVTIFAQHDLIFFNILNI